MWLRQRRSVAEQPDSDLGEIAVPYWLTGTAEAANATFWRMLRRLPGLLWDAAGLAWRTSPRAALTVLLSQVGAGLASAVSLVNVVGVLDGLLAAAPTPDRIRAAVPALALVVGAAAARALLFACATAAQGRLSPRVSRAAELRLLELTTRVDLATFDDAEWRDAMHRARDRGIDATQRLVDHAIEVVTALVSLIACAGVLAVLHPVLLPLLVIAVLPNGWAAVRAARLGYRQELKLITMLRRKWMLSDLLADRDAGPELRAFTIRDYLLAEVRRLLDVATRDRIALSAAQVRIALLGRFLGGVALGCAYAVLFWLLVSGRMDLAVGGAAAYAIGAGVTALTAVAFAVNHVYEQGLYFSDYANFSDLARARAEPHPSRDAPTGPGTIELSGVTFSYPGADRPAVCEVSLTVRAGETIALVGVNGSGKSTLAKLLAGLYRPDAGAIRWDGVDLAGVDPEAVRERVAVVMQEPTRWPLSAGANVSIGRYTRPADPALVEAAARAGDAHEFIVELPRGYDTLLSRHFVDGADLSGGQWQRLAVSRAFYRDAALLICDEPTANLDAQAEHDVYQRLRELSRGRTVVLITHRMASVRTADRIYVLDHGRLIEEGDHETLMALGGRYATLFRLQADAYHAVPEAG
ncbi:ABC transporter ATP-binding protein [Plantactinospora sp. GCM10030261]|uniref:ABC transporter ATP-binding protein n=1 Tax=Plantactinospora sp. GCM10030261 TaxID=3273420 RepID=UPI00360F372E